MPPERKARRFVQPSEVTGVGGLSRKGFREKDAKFQFKFFRNSFFSRLFLSEKGWCFFFKHHFLKVVSLKNDLTFGGIIIDLMTLRKILQTNGGL